MKKLVPNNKNNPFLIVALQNNKLLKMSNINYKTFESHFEDLNLLKCCNKIC